MLPIHLESERPSFAASPSFSQYMRRMIQYAQMDIDYTFAQMMYLCIAPRKVYQLTSYRKQTKNQWARDDPAFIVVLVFFLVVASVAYAVALGVLGSSLFRVLFLFIGVHFVAVGLVVSTICWFIANSYLRVQSLHGVEQRMEWMYAFDIHCNAFFPLFLLLYVLQYLLLPYLIQSSFLAVLLGNSLYAIALGYYSYVSSLGYSTLPFLERTEVFLYPSCAMVPVIVLLTLARVNLTRLSLSALGI
mmetsp:Transcript_64007/g.152634  ORF Transcript_64007/g.152634 Transcript_64007/m.152634 type:complete len:246 (+) Transcript_64007:80-817(+)